MMATSILLGVEARLAKTDAMLLLTIVAAMGAMARAYLGERRPPRPGIAGWTLPAIFWTALAARHSAQGPADPDVRRARRSCALAITDRSVALAAARCGRSPA